MNEVCVPALPHTKAPATDPASTHASTGRPSKTPSMKPVTNASPAPLVSTTARSGRTAGKRRTSAAPRAAARGSRPR
jgi:hypothetical protein